MQDAQAAPVGSAARVVRVLNCILRNGPMRPDALCDQTGLSRSAVHRAIHVLIDEGVLRFQLGRRKVALAADWCAGVDSAQLAPFDVDRAVSVIEQVTRGQRLQVELALLTNEGRFEVIEGSDPDRMAEPEAPMDSDLFITALTAFDQAPALSIMTKILKRGDGQVRAPDPEFIRRYGVARKQGYLWDEYSRELSVPIRLAEVASLSLRLWSRESLPRSFEYYSLKIAKMRELDPALFPDTPQP